MAHETGLNVTLVKSGPYGGDLEIGARSQTLYFFDFDAFFVNKKVDFPGMESKLVLPHKGEIPPLVFFPEYTTLL